MPMVWSPEQVKAGRIKNVKEAFKNKHLAWCLSSSSDCSCFGKSRETMLNKFAEAVAEEHREAKELYMKVVYGI